MEGFMKLMCIIFLGDVVCLSKAWDNLSLLPKYKGQASMEPYYSGYNAPPEGAVDGYLQGESGQNTCSYTWAQPFIKEAWWKFSLRSMANVAYMEIYFRRETVNRHVGFSVYVFNDSSYIPPLNRSQHKVFTHNMATCPERVTNVTINKEIQGIAIYNSKNPPVSTTCAGYEPTFATIEICEVKVMGCPYQHYGENCTPCDLKCRHRHCDAFDGACIDGCIDNAVKSHDCQECKNGFHGENCEFNCSKCTNGTFCDKITGVCPKGCQEHWNGTKCDVCENGFYGANCEFSCGKCRIGSLCDKITGICPEGCHDHWNGTRCEVCKEGFYGQTCEEKCGHCRNGTFCNTTTGVCTDGCKDYWDGLMCNVCSYGYYGNHCKDKCGHCLTGTLCDKSTGICSRGCKENWTGPKCDELSSTEKGSDDDGISKVSTAVISVVSTLFVVTFIVLVRNVYKKIKKRNLHTGKDAPEIMPGKLYDQLVETNTDPTYQKISSQSEVSHYQEMNVYKNDEFVQN